jgi:integrase
LRNRPIASITRADIAARLQELVAENGPVAAARARSNLSALFAWSIREGLYDGANVVADTNDPDTRHKRERVLSASEIKAVWSACQDDDFGAILRLLILLGARGSEIGGLKFSDINFDTGMLTIPGSRTKSHRALELPLPVMALNILHAVTRRADNDHLFGGDRGFLSWSKAKALLDARITAAEGRALVPWTIHDCRRTVATGMADLGVLPHTIEAVLNHVGHKAGIAGVYNKASYAREKAAALARWAAHLSGVLSGEKDRVVPLRTA